MEKTLDVTNMDELNQKVSDVKVHGNPGRWVYVSKASSNGQGWMKSTKVMQVEYEGGPPHGCLVQVSTQQKNPDGSYALAEAITFVPDATLKMFK